MISTRGREYVYTCYKCKIIFEWNHKRKTKQILDILREKVKDDFSLDGSDFYEDKGEVEEP